MKPSEIISLARRQTGCTEDIVTPEEAYRFLNFIIEDFGADIRASDSGFGFNVLNLDVYAGQSEYSFSHEDDMGTIIPFPLSKIQSVWLMGKDWKRHDLPVHFVDKVAPWQFVASGEPQACFITNNDIDIIPAPKENSQMMIWWFVYNPEFSIIPWIEKSTVEYRRNALGDIAAWTYPYCWTDANGTSLYTASETPTAWANVYTYSSGTYTGAGTIDKYIVNVLDKEEFIWIPKRWHSIIVEWMKYRMYGNMWVNFETPRVNSRSFYDSEKDKALQNIMDRWQLADTAYLPNLNFLNY